MNWHMVSMKHPISDEIIFYSAFLGTNWQKLYSYEVEKGWNDQHLL